MALNRRGVAIWTAALLLVSATASIAAAEPLTTEDRQRLISHLELTENWLQDEVKSLSPAQLKFRANDSSWSVMNVVEHLGLAEPQYWQGLQESMKLPLADAESDMADEEILWYGIDRTERSRTGEARVPHNEQLDVPKTLAAFHTLRRSMLDYARTTKDDLRMHRFRGGKMDVYQWFLMISTHAQRHILQIREIKSNPAFPKV